VESFSSVRVVATPSSDFDFIALDPPSPRGDVVFASASTISPADLERDRDIASPLLDRDLPLRLRDREDPGAMTCVRARIRSARAGAILPRFVWQPSATSSEFIGIHRREQRITIFSDNV
tara:strand:+ start:547 stop:906 length:360 start_codon:yes stop_codon:yes gene_type:complete